MPDHYAYGPQIDVAEEEGKAAWEADKGKWKKHLVAKYGKTGAKMVVKAVVNHFTFSAAGALFDAPAIYSTHQHIQHLGLLRNEPQYRCDCDFLAGTITCLQILEYCINQKTKKRTGAAIGTVPVIGTVNAVKGKVHALMKKDRGGARERNAKIAISKARNDCRLMQAMIAELCGSYLRHECWSEMFTILDWEEGWMYVKEKMASS